MSVRRAMALPIVLLLVLVAGVVISMMMDRHVSQALTVQRELQQYAFHHASKGVQEAVEAWLRLSGATRNMTEAIEQDGHAFDMVLEDGATVRVSLFDAQGGVLVEMAGLSQEARELARSMVGELQDGAGAEASRFIRREGPLPVSVNSAPPEVLAAAVSAATDGENVESIVDEILHARESEPISAEGLDAVFTQANVPPEMRPRLALAMTAQPSLWRVMAEVDGSQAIYAGRTGRRFCGLVVLSGNLSGNTKDRATALQRNSMITSWEDCTEQVTP